MVKYIILYGRFFGYEEISFIRYGSFRIGGLWE